MLNVVCVLRSGGEYEPSHVYWLEKQVDRHLTIPCRFVCLTDMRVAGIETVALPHAFPGWWAKINLFKPRLFDGPVFYIDLDTMIVGRIDDIVEGHKFTVLENFWREDRIGSGVMAWDVDLCQIYERFCSDPNRAMGKYRIPDKWGDQAWIKDSTPVQPERWQHKYPGRVVSWKRTILLHHGGVVPPAASIIAFHGRPRPWSTDYGKRLYDELSAA